MVMRYEEQGYCVVPKLLNSDEIVRISTVTEHFHQLWLKDNLDFYQSHAVNSAYLTSTKYLNEEQRVILFELIASRKISDLLAQLPFKHPAFMNTQLFFDPVNPKQNNYWHRDCQYHLDIEQQQLALQGPEVLHFRLALVDEEGIELVPGSHRCWDSPEELGVRTEQGNNKNHHDLSSGVRVPLKRGDLLIFSANMIHRGLYGNNRRALDILFCESTPDMLSFIERDCLPTRNTLSQVENRTIFIEPNTPEIAR